MSDESFEATLDHALRLTAKIRGLEDSLADTMRVLESLGRQASPEVVKAGAVRLRDACVPGRGAIRRLASTPVPLLPGQRFTRARRSSERWPDVSRVPAVVYLLLLNRQVQYIGYSTKIRDRLTAHVGKAWDSVEIIACDSVASAFALEGDLIHQHQPPLNVQDVRRRRHRGTHS